MTLAEMLKQQRTIRAYLDDPVPEAVIREVIELARLAPSNSNTQPWRIDVASGETRARLEAAIFEEIHAGIKPYPTFPPGGSGLTGRYKERQRECAWRYFEAVGIEREDKRARAELSLNNYRFFGAPHAAFLSYPETMHRANAIDLGIFLQTVMLLFVERGIGCCPQGALATYPGPVKALLPIPEGNAILCGLSFGYPDLAAQINSAAAKMEREPFEVVASITA
ncbi:MAG: nitroreductase [Pseudomonadales bacterium]